MLANVPRLKQLMKRAKLDAVIATCPENVTYLSGFWAMSQWVRRGPQAYVLFPHDTHETCIIANSGVLDLVPDQQPWVSEIRRYGYFQIDVDPAAELDAGDVLQQKLFGSRAYQDSIDALVAATHLLIPVQSSYFALEGTDDLLETVEKIRSRPNPDLKLLGAVITLHDKRTTLSRDVQKAIGDVFGDRVFHTTISKSIRLEESPAHKESIFTFAPQSSGAYEYYRLCEEVIERV